MALSREHVIDAAVEILRRYGLADLSMRRLARDLEVQPGALYWHVANKQDLLVGVADVLLSQVRRPDPGAGAREALASTARDVRAALAPVPDAADVVGLARSVAPDAIRPLRELAGLARRAGAAEGTEEAVAGLVLHHVLGSVADEQNAGRARQADPRHPVMTPEEAETAFEVGLEVILRGLAR